MKKLALLLAFLIPALLTSQSCLPDGIIFTTQAQIDSFQINYPNCTEIEGDVGIYDAGINNHEIYNLNRLIVLNSIAGNLKIITCDSLETLSGLDNLQTIGGTLQIGGRVFKLGHQGNSSLVSLSAFEKLQTIGGDLFIGCNYILPDLTGLESLTSIGGDLRISDSHSLVDLTGLDNLNTIGRNLQIGNGWSGGPDNMLLSDLTGLENLTSIGGSLLIKNSRAINSLAALNNLQYIPGDVEIGDHIPGYLPATSLTNFEGLENLDSIGGNVSIIYNPITSFTGLENLQSINGYLTISNNHFLTNLSGLAKLKFLGNDLRISNNNNLSNLAGMENLTYIVGGLSIFGNNGLLDLSGLEKITSIGDFFELYHTKSLESLIGLHNLTTVEGGLLIDNNDSLTNLSGLDALTSIGGDLKICFNTSLTSLEGVENLSPMSINELHIIGNSSLANCEADLICEYLRDPNGSINIFHNAPGCNNPNEIANSCGFELDCLPFGNYYLLSQSEVDSFQTNYSGCIDLKGNVFIGYPGNMYELNDINDLNKLNVIKSISGNLWIKDNDSLISFKGFDNLISIDGECRIASNNALNSFEGLENLTYINDFVISENNAISSLDGLEGLTIVGGDLRIVRNNALTSIQALSSLSFIGDDFFIYDTDALNSFEGLEKLDSIGGNFSIWHTESLNKLEGLENLHFIGGDLSIVNNSFLISLSGIDNIEAASIDSLYIYDNIYLHECEVRSICDYLSSPNGVIEIHDNAIGCDSIKEIEVACGTSVTEIILADNILCYPNPFTTSITIEYYLTSLQTVTITFYNQFGKQVDVIEESQHRGLNQIIWYPENLADGIYYFRIATSRMKAGEKEDSGKVVLVR